MDLDLDHLGYMGIITDMDTEVITTHGDTDGIVHGGVVITTMDTPDIMDGVASDTDGAVIITLFTARLITTTADFTEIVVMLITEVEEDTTIETLLRQTLLEEDPILAAEQGELHLDTELIVEDPMSIEMGSLPEVLTDTEQEPHQEIIGLAQPQEDA